MDARSVEIRDPELEEYSSTAHLRHAAQQARERRYQDFLIVDVDAHHHEAESDKDIHKYIDNPVLREMMKNPRGRRAFSNSQPGYQDLGRMPRHWLRTSEKTPAGPHRDAVIAHRWMDALGVDYAVLFPTSMLMLGLHPQVDIEVALSQAYNRWLCDTILSDNPRIISMLYLPMNDPEAAYRTVKEFGGCKGVVGFMVTSPRYKPVHDNVYMKTYALLQEMNLPLGFHAAYNWHDSGLATTNKFISVHALGFMWYNMIHMTNWVTNGLPERFPKLKVIWIESGLTWAYCLMQRLDHSYKMRTSECPMLKRKPSEYMREMYYTSQPLEFPDNLKTLEATFDMINAETQLLWSSDYPHWDFDLPSVIYDLPFLSEQSKRNMLGENAARLFNLDTRVMKSPL